MKNLFRTISVAMLFVVALTTIGAAESTYTATVQNNSSQNLGSVAIYASGQPYYIYVPGPGVFPIQVPSTPTMVVINSFVVPQGAQNVIVTVASGKKVNVSVSGNVVVVTDQTTVY
jgi:hypothetical protein